MKLLLLFLLQILSPVEKLQHLLDSLEHDDDAKNGIVAASIRSTQSGEYLLQHNDQKSVNSASTLKLVSTAVALSSFGANYKFSTYLEYDGYIQDSVLHGNIYIRGTGDPSLGTDRIGSSMQYILFDFSQQIKNYGIKKIEGNLLGDGSMFPTKNIADTWIWGDIGNYYGAGVSGLNINENLFKVVFRPSNKVGVLAPITRFQPEIPAMFFENKVLTAEKNSGDNVNIYSTPIGNSFYLDGTVPAIDDEFSVKGSIPDPAFLFAFHLSKKLEEIGIQITQPCISLKDFKQKNGYIPTNRFQIYRYDSPPLWLLAQYCNYESINLYADAFLKSYGYAYSKDGSFSSSIKAEKQFFQQKGVDLQGFMIKDGSGLSPSGVLTSKNLVDILYVMNQDSVFPDYYKSIPLVGINGTVQNLCKGTQAVGNVRAKSGSIQNTRAYAGYFTSTTNQLMCFAILVNRYNDNADKKIKNYLEKFMSLIVEI